MSKKGANQAQPAQRVTRSNSVLHNQLMAPAPDNGAPGPRLTNGMRQAPLDVQLRVDQQAASMRMEQQVASIRRQARPNHPSPAPAPPGMRPGNLASRLNQVAPGSPSRNGFALASAPPLSHSNAPPLPARPPAAQPMANGRIPAISIPAGQPRPAIPPSGLRLQPPRQAITISSGESLHIKKEKENHNPNVPPPQHRGPAARNLALVPHQHHLAPAPEQLQLDHGEVDQPWVAGLAPAPAWGAPIPSDASLAVAMADLHICDVLKSMEPAREAQARACFHLGVHHQVTKHYLEEAIHKVTMAGASLSNAVASAASSADPNRASPLLKNHLHRYWSLLATLFNKAAEFCPNLSGMVIETEVFLGGYMYFMPADCQVAMEYIQSAVITMASSVNAALSADVRTVKDATLTQLVKHHTTLQHRQHSSHVAGPNHYAPAGPSNYAAPSSSNGYKRPADEHLAPRPPKAPRIRVPNDIHDEARNHKVCYVHLAHVRDKEHYPECPDGANCRHAHRDPRAAM